MRCAMEMFASSTDHIAHYALSFIPLPWFLPGTTAHPRSLVRFFVTSDAQLFVQQMSAK